MMSSENTSALSHDCSPSGWRASPTHNQSSGGHVHDIEMHDPSENSLFDDLDFEVTNKNRNNSIRISDTSNGREVGYNSRTGSKPADEARSDNSNDGVRRQFFSYDTSDYEENYFMKKLYENAVEGPCQGGPPRCQISIDEPLELFTDCQQPLAFLSMFRQDETTNTDCADALSADPAEIENPMYMVPTSCEYCGAKETSQCSSNPSCSRPKLYFQKKRPPFCKRDPERWDPETDNALVIKKTTDKDSTEGDNPPESTSNKQSWMSGLFITRE